MIEVSRRFDMKTLSATKTQTSSYAALPPIVGALRFSFRKRCRQSLIQRNSRITSSREWRLLRNVGCYQDLQCDPQRDHGRVMVD
jgi:hypothetical protein